MWEHNQAINKPDPSRGDMIWEQVGCDYHPGAQKVGVEGGCAPNEEGGGRGPFYNRTSSTHSPASLANVKMPDCTIDRLLYSLRAELVPPGFSDMGG